MQGTETRNTLGATLPGELALLTTADEATLLRKVADQFDADQAFSVATLNLDHIVKLRRDQDFARAYARQSFVVADGNPIVWLARTAGAKLELVPGSELIAPLTALAAQKGLPIALLGATEDTLAAAADALVAENPGLRVVAQIAPPFGFDPAGPDADAALDELRRAGARLCFLALGAPKQELLAARAQDLVPGCGFVSIGAGLDFIAGSQTRAPVWVRRIAMEWLWRMLSNPRRLALRYWQCFKILPGLHAQARRAGSNSTKG